MKYILLIIFFAHFSFGEDKSVNLDITGKWILAAVETEENDIKDQVKPGSASMEFKGDGSLTFTFSGSDPSSGTYTIGKESLTVLSIGWGKDPMKYTLANNTIKINVVNATWMTFIKSDVASKPVLTTAQLLLAAENSARDLGSLLIKSLMNNDFKTYQSCWITLDFFNKIALESGLMLTEDESKQKKSEFDARDADIKESFVKITSLFK